MSEQIPAARPTQHSLTWEVTDEMTAKRIGSAGSKILSTPNMVALMEACALELAKAYLDEGQTTVGAEIHCRHLAPTPVGMKVTATATLRSIERRKMWFDLVVTDEKGKCGEGSHLRVMVNSKAMAQKGESKKEE
ncbi:MAG: thioesterase family protein [Eubacteriales bacterium]|nr:thioesterase family protein [Eubacteriales bacterium]